MRTKPINSYLTGLLAILLTSVSANAQEDTGINEARHDSFWHGFNEGCIGRDIYWDVFYFDYDTNLSYRSFTVGMKPDSNNGPSFIARLDTGLSGQTFGETKNNPETLFLAWSLPYATCIVKTNFQACPQAKLAYNKLQNTKLSLNEDFDKRPGMFVLHYTTFNMQQRDGSGQFNDWEVTSGDTDLEAAIYAVAKDTLQCSQKAVDDLFKRLKIDANHGNYKAHNKRFHIKPPN